MQKLASINIHIHACMHIYVNSSLMEQIADTRMPHTSICWELANGLGNPAFSPHIRGQSLGANILLHILWKCHITAYPSLDKLEQILPVMNRDSPNGMDPWKRHPDSAGCPLICCDRIWIIICPVAEWHLCAARPREAVKGVIAFAAQTFRLRDLFTDWTFTFPNWTNGGLGKGADDPTRT